VILCPEKRSEILKFSCPEINLLCPGLYTVEAVLSIATAVLCVWLVTAVCVCVCAVYRMKKRRSSWRLMYYDRYILKCIVMSKGKGSPIFKTRVGFWS